MSALGHKRTFCGAGAVSAKKKSRHCHNIKFTGSPPETFHMPLRIRRVTDGAHFRDGRLLLGSRSAGAADEILHFFQGNEAIFVGIHRLEDALVGRLKLLQ